MIRYGTPPSAVTEELAERGQRRLTLIEEAIASALVRANEFVLAGKVERGKWEIFQLGQALALSLGDRASYDELSQLRYVEIGPRS